MDQSLLFYDSFRDALRDDVQALGGPKEVGRILFPEKPVDQARNALNDRLNVERRERLSDEQEQMIMRLARERRGFSAAICYLCDAAGFERPRALNPEDERAKRERELIETIRTAERLTEELRRLSPAAVRLAK